MGSILGGQNKTTQAQQPTAAAGVQIQTSTAGKVVPVVVGTAKLAPNLTWYGASDFKAISHQQSGGGGGGGGKGGGGGSGGSTTSYTYQVAFAMGLCEGPIAGIGVVWAGNTVTNAAALGCAVFDGAYGQAPWGWLQTAHPAEALPYSGIAYFAAAQYDLGSSTSLPNHNVEIYGFYSSSVVGRIDANPSPFVASILTDHDWGIAPAFPAGMVGDLTMFGAYCVANGLLMSAAYTEQQTAAQVIDDIATYTNADVAWTGSVFNIIPRGDQPITANGVTYQPAPFTFVLGDDDWLLTNAATTSSGGVSDPLVLTQNAQDQIPNEITFEYYDRAAGYVPKTVTARDPAAIQEFGRNASDPKQAHIFADAPTALLSAQLYLQRLWDSDLWQGTVAEHRVRIDIGDRGIIGSVVQGIDPMPVIVQEIAEQSDGTVLIVFESYQSGIGTALARSVRQSTGYSPNYNADPGDVIAPIIFEPPDALAGALEVWIGASSANPIWAGAEVWVSDDGVTYRREATITARCRQGTLTAAIGAGPAQVGGAAAIDTSDTLDVDLSASAGELSSGAQKDAINLNTLCWCDGELMAYRTAALIGANAYALSYLVRGAYGTPAGAHAAGAPFAYVDKAFVSLPFTADMIGRTLHVKFLSFNAWGGGLQQLPDVPAYTYTITGSALMSPLPPVTGLSTAYVAGITNLTWQWVTDFRTVDYEIREGASPASARLIGRTPTTQAPTAGDGTYWIAAHYQVPNGPDVYSQWASVVVAGSQLTSNVIAVRNQAAEGWRGTYTDTALSGQYLALVGAGDVTQAADMTTVSDVVWYGGVVSSGTYQIPVTDRVDVGRVATCNVLMTVAGLAYDINAVDVTAITDITAVADIIGVDVGGRAGVIPQIRLSQDGLNWDAWQTWIPGAYTARAFDARLLLVSSDPQVSMLVSGFVFTVDVPTRVDHYAGVAVPAAGLTLQFTPDGSSASAPFNGGPGGTPDPLVHVDVLGAQAGDTVSITAVTRASVTVQILNNGVGVARTANIIAEGY